MPGVSIGSIRCAPGKSPQRIRNDAELGDASKMAKNTRFEKSAIMINLKIKVLLKECRVLLQLFVVVEYDMWMFEN